MKKSECDITPDELARFRALFALRRMSPELQGEVLSDGTIAGRTAIGVSNPIKLPEDITVERKTLFSAFEKAADGEPTAEISDINGIRRDIKTEIDGDSGFLTFGTHRICFPHAALLSARPERRRAVADIILKNNTLTRQGRDDFEAIIDKTDFSDSDFFAAINILSGSPEHFATTLREVAKKGSLSTEDFLPTAATHWENVTARRLTSDQLQDFIAQELASERSARIAQDPKVAVDVLSLTFGGPELVPLEAMREIDPNVLLDALKHLLDYADPVALSGAFDVCADRAATDERFIELGDTILNGLIDDPKRLRSELTTFATAFVLATAYLAEHETLRQQPVFWRRLAASSHASLVTRILGLGADDETSLLTWATRLKGKTFYLSVFNDGYSEPRWRPDWISPDFLAADIYGRLLGSMQRLGDTAPPTWSEKLKDADSSMVSNVPPFAYTFPGLLQGWWAAPTDMPPVDTPVGEMFANLTREPTVENFLYFIPLVYAFGFPVDARDLVLKVVQSLRTEIAAIPTDYAQAALDLAGFIAARNRDVELADAVATISIERLVATQDVDRILSTASTILECAAAGNDRKEAMATLARRLENLAFVASPESLAEALDILRILQSINEDLAPLLARAVATARLGLPRTAAA